MIAVAAYLVVGVIFMVVFAMFVDALEIGDGAGSALNVAVLFAWPLAVPLAVTFALFVWIVSAGSRLRDRATAAIPTVVRIWAQRARRALRVAVVVLAVLLWGTVAFAMIATFVEGFPNPGARL